jgi:hypothetical protein
VTRKSPTLEQPVPRYHRVSVSEVGGLVWRMQAEAARSPKRR